MINKLVLLIDNINESKSFWGKFKLLMGSKRNNKLGNISKNNWKKIFSITFYINGQS